MREEVAIPFIVFFSIFGYLAVRRYFEYKETVILAEKGLVKPRDAGDGKDGLRWGIVLAALGLALFLGSWTIGFVVGHSFPLGLGPWLLPGLMTLFFGLGLILAHLVTRREEPAATATDSLPYVDYTGQPAQSPAPVPGWDAPTQPATNPDLPAAPPS
jgi:hypothetical protein